MYEHTDPDTLTDRHIRMLYEAGAIICHSEDQTPEIDADVLTLLDSGNTVPVAIRIWQQPKLYTYRCKCCGKTTQSIKSIVIFHACPARNRELRNFVLVRDDEETDEA